ADFEAAAAIDPGNLVAATKLAVLALGSGELAEARRLADPVLAREPGYPEAMMTLAGADLAEGRFAPAEAALAGLLADPRLAPLDRAMAVRLRGDALDALGRFAEAFAAWTEANRLERDLFAPDLAGRSDTLALVRHLTDAVA